VLVLRNLKRLYSDAPIYHRYALKKCFGKRRGDDHEEDDDYLDILLQEAIDEVNRRSFGRHVPHEEMVSIDVESENYSSSFKFLVDDAVQPFQTVNKMKKLACPKTTLNVF
jgi:hypothetical protein